MSVRGGGGGVEISAGTQVAGAGIVSFSNANGVTFGLNNGTLTATVNPGAAAGIAGVLAGTQTQTSGSLSFVNSNGLTFGMSGSSALTASYNSTQFAGTGSTFAGTNVSGSMTVNSAGVNLALSANAGGGGGPAISAAGSSQNAGTIVFSNSNGVSFGMNGSTVTGSVGAQSNQSLGIYGSSQTTGQSSSSTVDARSLTFVGGGNVSVGLSGGSVLISGAAGGQTNQSIGLYGISNTTGASSSTTIDARSFSMEGAGAISVGGSNGSWIVSAPATVALTQFSGGFSTGGNTLGTSGLATAQLVLVGSSNIQLSGSTSSGSMTITIIDSGALSNINVSAGAASNNLSALTFSNANGVSFGLAGSVITASAAGAAADSFGVSNIGNTSGNTGIYSGQVVLAGGNNVTLSVSSGAAGAQTITVSAAAQTAQTVGIYASSQTVGQSSSSTVDARSISYVGQGIVSVGLSAGSVLLSATTAAQSNQTWGLYFLNNTTGASSSSTVDARSVSFTLGGALSGGMTGGSLELSVPQTSSIIGTNGISVSTNGSTISISGLAATVPYWEPSNIRGQTTSGSNAAGTLYVYPFVPEHNISAVRLQFDQQYSTQLTTTMSVSGSVSGAVASSATGTFGLYGTALLFSRVSTGTAANSSQILSFFSNTYSYGVGQSESISASTNGVSATVSLTTSGAITYLASINSTGGASTGSFGTSGSTSFSSSSAVGGTFSSSFGSTFASSVLSGVRPIIVPFGTSLSAGEYWLGHIQSSNTASTNYSLQNVVNMGLPGIVHFSTNTQGYLEIGATATVASSNLQQGWGSYSSSGNTTTTLPLTAISNMGQSQLWFNLVAATK